ncbi:hypothetical protein FACS1894190_05820 [Spirochaetia bacterium]|nr:hypothetical protein FACS1894190_05820 [Spirochaetia bacterium]
MNCKRVQDFLYGCFENSTLLERFLVFIHLIHCNKCSYHEALINRSTTIMRNEFLPPEENNFSEKVISMINIEDLNAVDAQEAPEEGFVNDNANGVTIGGVITAFGTVFIGGHLDEFSKRFDGLVKRLGFR